MLVHGDCRHMTELEDDSVDLVITDPPFNVSGRHGRREFDYGDGAQADALPPEEYASWCGEWIEECLRVLRPGGQLYSLMSLKWLPYWAPILKGRYWRMLPWVKTMAFLHRENTWLSAWEPIIWLVKEGAKHELRRAYRFAEDKDWVIGGTAVAEAEVNRLKKQHPTPRPDWIYEYFIVRSSKPGDLVLDPMMGSGTGARVSRRLGRRFVGYDINPAYVELSRQMVSQMPMEMPPVAEELPAGQLELMADWEQRQDAWYPGRPRQPEAR